MEVYLHNPWLTYGMGIHRLREAGLVSKLMDNLDEKEFNLDEIHQFCREFFLGEDPPGMDLPHPRNWSGFMRGMKHILSKEKLQWNPVKKKVTPWINLKQLDSMYRRARDDPYHEFPKRPINSEPLRHSSSFEDSPRDQHSTSEHRSHPSSIPRRHSDEYKQRRQPRQPSTGTSGNGGSAPTSAPANYNDDDLTLVQVLQRWSHEPPDYKKMHSLQDLLVTVPLTFPPNNDKVEPHEYFSKWKTFSREAFAGNGDELKELLKRGT